MERLGEILHTRFNFSDSIGISVLDIIFIAITLLVTHFILKFINRLAAKKIPKADLAKYNTVSAFAKWFVYIIVILVILGSIGVKITAALAASAALLVGIGLALQTYFQDIISGIFIISDQSVQVGDVIELDGKVGKVVQIKLRTTRMVTIDNRVLVIPNHKYLTNILFNWTQNGVLTRESIKIRVALDSDVKSVKKILYQTAEEHRLILKNPPPLVLFKEFGESALIFELIFSVTDSFNAREPKSDLHFAIVEKFRANNITVPFPQRVVYLEGRLKD